MDEAECSQLALREQADVVRCRQAVRALAERQGFGLTGQTMLMTAASELARNTLKYGGGGSMHYAVIRTPATVGIRLVFTDQGPGIADVQQAMQEGWSSGRGLGLGLSGAKRLVHLFELVSAVGKGTRVSVVRWK